MEAAGVRPALGGRRDLRGTAGGAERGAVGRHLQCGACTAEAGEGLGRGRGRERASARETKAVLPPPIPASLCAGGAALAPQRPAGSWHLRPGAAELRSLETPEPGSLGTGERPGEQLRPGTRSSGSFLRFPQDLGGAGEGAPKRASLRCRTSERCKCPPNQTASEGTVRRRKDESGSVAGKLADGETKASSQIVLNSFLAA